MSVYQKQNCWYIDYYVHGRRKREKIGPSRRLAVEVLRKRKVEIAENRYLDVRKNEKVRFKDFAHMYMELHSKPNKRSWKKSDANSLRRLIPFFGNKYLYEITPLMIERYKIARREQVSPATVNRELACLKVMFSKAIDWGKAKENPVRKVKLYRERNGRLRYLDQKEINMLLEHCSPKLRAIVVTAINTGMRKGEIQRLKWQDIDFKQGMIQLLETKNGEKRYIPMNALLRQELMRVKRHSKSDYVFCDKHGRIYNFRKSFDTALKKSGILSFRFHDLRHTFASHLAMSGVDLNTIRELLGHKSLAMTLRYSHLSKSHNARAVEKLGFNIDTNTDTKRILVRKKHN